MLQQFMVLLNEKKRKIRDQSRLLADAKVDSVTGKLESAQIDHQINMTLQPLQFSPPERISNLAERGHHARQSGKRLLRHVRSRKRTSLTMIRWRSSRAKQRNRMMSLGRKRPHPTEARMTRQRMKAIVLLRHPSEARRRLQRRERHQVPGPCDPRSANRPRGESYHLQGTKPPGNNPHRRR